MSFSVAPFLILAISLVLVMIGAWVLLRHKWVLQWIKGSLGLAVIALAVYLVLVAMNLYGFHELNAETPVATVSFRKTGDQSFVATVTRPDGEAHDYRLQGDQWQLDARIAKWKMPFELLGLKPGYQLDRIEGRYYALEDERSKPHTAYSLRPGNTLGMDIWREARRGWSFLVDARYGSAAYLPMADGAIFEVTVTPGGLVGRPMNGSARQAVAGWQ